MHVAYQSRLGPMEWLKTYMEDKLKIKSKVIIYQYLYCWYSETEYELDMEYLSCTRTWNNRL